MNTNRVYDPLSHHKQDNRNSGHSNHTRPTFKSSCISQLLRRNAFLAEDATTIENQQERYQEYSDFIDMTLENFVSDSPISPDIAPELAGKITVMIPSIKAALKRKFMADNNIVPELFEISMVDEEGRPSFDLLQITEDHLAGLAVNLMSFAKAIVPIEQAVAKDSETLNLGNDAQGGFGGGGYDSGGSSSGSSGGDDEFGLSDMDLSLTDSSPNPESENPDSSSEVTPPPEE